MHMLSRTFCAALSLGCLPSLATAEGPGLGQPIDTADIAAWDIDVHPDGSGLPSGVGTSAEGATIFATKCALCHGQDGKGGIGPALITTTPVRGVDESTVTIANYWPYATTLFDYIRHAMPWQKPRSLSDHEVYALTAFLLAQNKIIPASQPMNAQTLPKVEMPNRDGFVARFPDRMPK